MSAQKICRFFQSSTGCQNGDKCRWVHMAPSQSNTGSLLGVMGSETIEIPANDSAVIVGKKGSTIKHLRTACGEAQVDLPEFKKDKKSYPLTIIADLGVLQALIVEITNVLLNNNREIHYLIPYLKKYELFAFIEYLQQNGQIKRESSEYTEERPSKRPTLLTDDGYLNNGMTGEYGSNMMQGDMNMINSMSMQSGMIQGTGLETDYGQSSSGMNAMIGSSGMSSLNNSGSGWGPMIDESKSVGNIPIPNVEDTLDIIKEVGNKSGILPNKKEFLYLSQHVVTDAFVPSISSHPKSMRTKPQEIVTFVQQCACSQNCGYALFRNAVDESGYLPIQIISDEILKFECAYCDDVNEFYQEKDYLTHAVLVHFWRRISSFLDEVPPYTCPVVDCGKQFLNFKTLVLHYGGIPHKKVGALILDSVGERVKNVREVSKGQIDNSGELEKAKRYIEELKQRVSNMELSKQNSSASDQNLSTVQNKLLESKNDVASLTKQKEVLQKLKLQVEQDLKKKETALKNSQEALSSNLKKINELKDEVHDKSQEIKDLKKSAASKSSSSNSNVVQSALNKAEVERMKKEIARLKQLIKDKDEHIATLEASSGGNAGGGSALIEKLKKTIKSQKNMLHLKQKEIELIKEGMEAEDEDGVIDLD